MVERTVEQVLARVRLHDVAEKRRVVPLDVVEDFEPVRLAVRLALLLPLLSLLFPLLMFLGCHASRLGNDFHQENEGDDGPDAENDAAQGATARAAAETHDVPRGRRRGGRRGFVATATATAPAAAARKS